jgi:hypothetical protein
MSAPSPKKSARASAASKPRLLTGGNPQIPKGDGDAPVRAYLAAMPGWKRPVGERLDRLIGLHLPGVRKAVRWNAPFYGLEGRGWLVSLHVLTRSVRLNFFSGASLVPVPPGGGKDPHARWLDLHEGEALDEDRIGSWLEQCTRLQGWMQGPALPPSPSPSPRRAGTPRPRAR